MRDEAGAVWNELEPRLGRAWVKSPDLKIPVGTEVCVVALSEGGMVALIEWGKERRRQVYAHHLDFGMEFRTRSGKWVPEWDPRVALWIPLAVADLRAMGTRILSKEASHGWRKELADRFERVRQRNRWGR